VRELDNIMRRLTVLQDQDVIIREIQNKVAQNATAISTVAVLAPAETAPVLDQVIKATHQAESNAILTALNATRWNRKQAAAILKIDYKALLYKMKKLGIEGGPPRTPMGRKSTGSPVFTASI
jgi:DNA-binding NtrC family response regulator